MVRSRYLVGCALLTLARSPLALPAQTHEGFYANFGVGAGSFGAEQIDAREGGLAGQTTLGWAFTPRLLVAAEGSAWTRKKGTSRRTHVSAHAVVQLRPLAGSGLFVRGGLGISHLRASSSTDALSYRFADSALGLSTGAGYDFPLTSRLSISPYGLFVLGVFEGGSANHLQGGIGVTWH